MKRKHKKYQRPKRLYDSARIKAENKLADRYGLKNKKEIWKTQAKVNYFRSRAKSLITADKETQQRFFNKLNQLGLKINSVADILSLTIEDLLKRRLSTVVAERGFASTPKQARQMIAHKRVLLNARVMNVPGHIVKVDEENAIEIKRKAVKIKAIMAEEKIAAQAEIPEKISEEMSDG